MNSFYSNPTQIPSWNFFSLLPFFLSFYFTSFFLRSALLLTSLPSHSPVLIVLLLARLLPSPSPPPFPSSSPACCLAVRGNSSRMTSLAREPRHSTRIDAPLPPRPPHVPARRTPRAVGSRWLTRQIISCPARYPAYFKTSAPWRSLPSSFPPPHLPRSSLESRAPFGVANCVAIMHPVDACDKGDYLSFFNQLPCREHLRLSLPHQSVARREWRWEKDEACWNIISQGI